MISTLTGSAVSLGLPTVNVSPLEEGMGPCVFGMPRREKISSPIEVTLAGFQKCGLLHGLRKESILHQEEEAGARRYMSGTLPLDNEWLPTTAILTSCPSSRTSHGRPTESTWPPHASI